MCRPINNRSAGGFTLIEIAIVMIVVGYLLNQLIAPFGAQREHAMRSRSLQQLNNVIDNAMGYAISHHRLPCPAGVDTQGVERNSCEGDLAIGYVPAVTLGMLGPTDNHGRLLDSWGRPVIYAVSQSDHPQRGEQGKPDFVSVGEIGNVGLPYLESELVVCKEINTGKCSRANVRANQVPLIVVSLGSDDSVSGQQEHNQDKDAIFVSQSFMRTGENHFDDLVVWLSESKLIFNLVRAGTL